MLFDQRHQLAWGAIFMGQLSELVKKLEAFVAGEFLLLGSFQLLEEFLQVIHTSLFHSIATHVVFDGLSRGDLTSQMRPGSPRDPIHPGPDGLLA